MNNYEIIHTVDCRGPLVYVRTPFPARLSTVASNHMLTSPCGHVAIYFSSEKEAQDYIDRVNKLPQLVRKPRQKENRI